MIQDKLVESSEMTTPNSLHVEELTLFLSLRYWEPDHKTSRHYVPHCFIRHLQDFPDSPEEDFCLTYLVFKTILWSSQHVSFLETVQNGEELPE